LWALWVAHGRIGIRIRLGAEIELLASLKPSIGDRFQRSCCIRALYAARP
jgi:hypothetical protein